MALRKIDRTAEANKLFEKLIEAGRKSLEQKPAAAGFFAKFGEGQSERYRLARAHYLVGLGHSGLGQATAAKQAFQRALDSAPDHLGAKAALEGWVE